MRTYAAHSRTSRPNGRPATAKGAGGDAFSDEKLETLFRSMEAKFKAEMGLVDAEGEGEAAEGGY